MFTVKFIRAQEYPLVVNTDNTTTFEEWGSNVLFEKFVVFLVQTPTGVYDLAVKDLQFSRLGDYINTCSGIFPDDIKTNISNLIGFNNIVLTRDDTVELVPLYTKSCVVSSKLVTLALPLGLVNKYSTSNNVLSINGLLTYSVRNVNGYVYGRPEVFSNVLATATPVNMGAPTTYENISYQDIAISGSDIILTTTANAPNVIPVFVIFGVPIVPGAHYEGITLSIENGVYKVTIDTNVISLPKVVDTLRHIYPITMGAFTPLDSVINDPTTFIMRRRGGQIYAYDIPYAAQKGLGGTIVSEKGYDTVLDRSLLYPASRAVNTNSYGLVRASNRKNMSEEEMSVFLPKYRRIYYS